VDWLEPGAWLDCLLEGGVWLDGRLLDPLSLDLLLLLLLFSEANSAKLFVFPKLPKLFPGGANLLLVLGGLFALMFYTIGSSRACSNSLYTKYTIFYGVS
jgi:hypothetical protein